MTFLIGPEAASAFFKASDKELGQDEVYGFMKAVFGEGVVYDSDPKKRNLQMQRTRHHGYQIHKSGGLESSGQPAACQIASCSLL